MHLKNLFIFSLIEKEDHHFKKKVGYFVHSEKKTALARRISLLNLSSFPASLTSYLLLLLPVMANTNHGLNELIN
jgi:hypothetical protein